MILLGYIILGHPEWKEGIINIFVLYQPSQAEKKRDELQKLIKEGRLPISMGNISLVSASEDNSNREVIGETSVDADLTIIGFRHEQLRTEGYNTFTDYDKLGNILFVSANTKKEIK